jgi:hypothetical protein
MLDVIHPGQAELDPFTTVDALQSWLDRQSLEPSLMISILVASAAERAKTTGFSTVDFQEVIDAVKDVTWNGDVLTTHQQTEEPERSLLPTG